MRVRIRERKPLRIAVKQRRATRPDWTTMTDAQARAEIRRRMGK